MEGCFIRCVNQTPDDRSLPFIYDSTLETGALFFTYEGDATDHLIKRIYQSNTTVFEGIPTGCFP